MIAHDDIVARFVQQRVKRGEHRELLSTRYRRRGSINLQSFGLLYHLCDQAQDAAIAATKVQDNVCPFEVGTEIRKVNRIPWIQWVALLLSRVMFSARAGVVFASLHFDSLTMRRSSALLQIGSRFKRNQAR